MAKASGVSFESRIDHGHTRLAVHASARDGDGDGGGDGDGSGGGDRGGDGDGVGVGDGDWYDDGVITTALASEDANSFVVTVRVADRAGETVHTVTVPRADLARLARPNESVTSFVERCFEFLLAREPKESIMRRFDVMVIARYFPEFEDTIRR